MLCGRKKILHTSLCIFYSQSINLTVVSTVFVLKVKYALRTNNLQFSIFRSYYKSRVLAPPNAQERYASIWLIQRLFYQVSHSFLAKASRDDDCHSLLVMLNNCVQNGKVMFPVVCFVCCSAKQENNHILRHTNLPFRKGKKQHWFASRSFCNSHRSFIIMSSNYYFQWQT